MAVLPVEGLDRGFALHAFDHGHDDVAVLRRILLVDEDVVAVEDACVDHRLAVHREHEVRSPADEPAGHREAVFDVLFGEDGRAGGDAADDGQIHDVVALDGRRGLLRLAADDVHRAALAGLLLDEPLILQLPDGLVDRGRGLDAQIPRDVADRGRIAPLGHVFAHVFQDPFFSGR